MTQLLTRPEPPPISELTAALTLQVFLTVRERGDIYLPELLEAIPSFPPAQVRSAVDWLLRRQQVWAMVLPDADGQPQILLCRREEGEAE